MPDTAVTGRQNGAMSEAARRWAENLASWSIPQEILDRAPEPPWGFPTALFTRAAEQALHELRGIGMSATVQPGSDLPPPDYSGC